jgi:hypothetical protein
MSADLVNDKNRIEEGLLAHLADVGSIADSIDFASNSGFDHSVRNTFNRHFLFRHAAIISLLLSRLLSPLLSLF